MIERDEIYEESNWHSLLEYVAYSPVAEDDQDPFRVVWDKEELEVALYLVKRKGNNIPSGFLEMD